MGLFRRELIDIGLMVFELTDACNQACKFCYNHFKASEGCHVAAPDYREARRTLKRLLGQARIGVISLSGGEPMLMPHIHDIVLKARFAGSTVNLLTNGTLLNDHHIGIFNDLGVGTIQIPLLADTAERHDSITALDGSWQRALTAARKVAATREGWLTPVLILSRMNIDRIEPTLRLYAELGARRAMVNRFNIGGLGIRNAERLVMSPAELREAFHRVDKVAGELGLNIHNGVCTPICLLAPRDYHNITFSHCTTDLKSRPLTINYRGDVRFCNHSPRVLGNIHQEPLAKIIERSTNDGYFDSRPAQCSACQLWERCRGGCRAASEQVYGRFDMADPILEGGV